MTLFQHKAWIGRILLRLAQEEEDSLISNDASNKESIQTLETEIEEIKSIFLVSTERLGILATEAQSFRTENSG
jgi:hypothetical protein